MNLKTRNIVLASLILVCFSNIASFSQAGPVIPGEDYYVYTSHPSDQEVLKDTSFTITWRLYTNDVGRYYDLIRISPSGQTYTLRTDWRFVNGQAISYSTRLATPGIHTYKIVADTSHCSPYTDEVKVKVKYSTDDYDGDGLPNEYDENVWVVDEVDEDDTWTVMCYLSADIDGGYDQDNANPEIGQYIEYLAAEFKSTIISDLTDNSNVNFAYLMDGYHENEKLDPFNDNLPIHGSGPEILPTLYIEGDEPYNEVELNMGNPITLSNFIAWSQYNLPAENYMLVIQSHGFGVHAPESEFDPNTLGGCSLDSTDDNDHLTIMEIHEAIEDKEIDILGFDNCYMGATEFLYELKDDVAFMIASEQGEPQSSIENYGGWPFDSVFSFLDDHPHVSQEMFCKYVVDSYEDAINPSMLYTMAYVRTSELTDLYADVQLFCNNLIHFYDFRSEMKDVFENLTDGYQFLSKSVSEYVKSDYIDFITFLSMVKIKIPDLTTDVDRILGHLSDTIGYYRGNIGEETGYGLSIFLPYGSDQEYFSNYAQYQWAIDTHWDTFIYEYIEEDTAPNPAQDPPNDLISHWKFNDDATDSVGDNDGTAYGSPTSINDRLGNTDSAYGFDGIDDYLNAGNDASLDLDTFTVSSWIKTTGTGYKMWMTRGPGQYWLAHHTSRLSFTLTTSTGRTDMYADSAYDYHDDEWHHVANTYDGAFMRQYFDGELINELAKTGTISGLTDMLIGRYTSSYQYTGDLDDVKVFNKALSSENINQLYQGDDPAPLTYYTENFDNMAGGYPDGWTCIDYPSAYNFISIVGTTAPFTSQSLRIIDSQGGMIVSGQTTIPTPFSTGEIELDFSILNPGLAGYPGEYYLYLYDSGSQEVISIKFYAVRGVGWSVGITGAGMSGYANFDTSIENHLNLKLTQGNAELFLNGASVSTKSFANGVISQFKLYSTPISIGFIYFDNIIMHN